MLFKEHYLMYWAGLHYPDLYNTGSCNEADQYIAAHPTFQYMPTSYLPTLYSYMTGWQITQQTLSNAVFHPALPANAWNFIRAQGGTYQAYMRANQEWSAVKAALGRGQINNDTNQVDTCNGLFNVGVMFGGVATIFGIAAVVGGGPPAGLVAAVAGGISVFAFALYTYKRC